MAICLDCFNIFLLLMNSFVFFHMNTWGFKRGFNVILGLTINRFVSFNCFVAMDYGIIYPILGEGEADDILQGRRRMENVVEAKRRREEKQAEEEKKRKEEEEKKRKEEEADKKSESD